MTIRCFMIGWLAPIDCIVHLCIGIGTSALNNYRITTRNYTRMRFKCWNSPPYFQFFKIRSGSPIIISRLNIWFLANINCCRCKIAIFIYRFYTLIPIKTPFGHYSCSTKGNVGQGSIAWAESVNAIPYTIIICKLGLFNSFERSR